jgi:GT2 family glycosyltransferase
MNSSAHSTPVDCAVLVVTYNSADFVGDLLDSLPAAAGGLSLRPVVVDNGSSDGTVALVRSRAEVRCIEAGANLGYAGGINLAQRYAGAYERVLVLNPDLVLEAGAIAELAAALRDPAVGLAVPMILDSAGGLELTLRREPSLSRAVGDALFGRRLPRRPGWLSETVLDERQYRNPRSVDWAGGAAAMASRDCAAAVGPWDERFFLYSEEVDYAARVRAAGFRIEYVPAARVRHHEGGSGSSASLTALQAVNRVRYVEKRGRGGSGAFRAAVALHELLRSYDPAHRTALRSVLRKSRWSELLGGSGSARPHDAHPVPPDAEYGQELELGPDPPLRTAVQRDPVPEPSTAALDVRE